MANKQIIIDVYEFKDGFLIETSITEPNTSSDSKKKIVRTLQEVEDYMNKCYIDFSLDGK